MSPVCLSLNSRHCDLVRKLREEENSAKHERYGAFHAYFGWCLECDGKPIKIRCEHVSLRTTPSVLSLLWYAAVTSCFNMLAPLPKYTDTLGSVSLTH